MRWRHETETVAQPPAYMAGRRRTACGRKLRRHAWYVLAASQLPCSTSIERGRDPATNQVDPPSFPTSIRVDRSGVVERGTDPEPGNYDPNAAPPVHPTRGRRRTRTPPPCTFCPASSTAPQRRTTPEGIEESSDSYDLSADDSDSLPTSGTEEGTAEERVTGF